jgi:hypothetical protein
VGKKKQKKDFDKYFYYENSVQNVENDIEFINEQYLSIRGTTPLILREDFGGTGKLVCDWVKQSGEHFAYAIDLDPEPIEYGLKNHHILLKNDQKERAKYFQKNVLESENVKSDVIVAFNFSYFIFKKRQELLSYFKSVRSSLKDGGVFFLDLFGGEEAQTIVEEETEHEGYSYFWDCDKFDPITNECLFKIHFKIKGKKKNKDVFVYDWRLWSLPELVDLLHDAGFNKVLKYWEKEDKKGEGTGEFYATEHEENCESWVTYLAAYND